MVVVCVCSFVATDCKLERKSVEAPLATLGWCSSLLPPCLGRFGGGGAGGGAGR